MRMARTLCCALMALFVAQAAMAQEDLKALNAEKKHGRKKKAAREGE